MKNIMCPVRTVHLARSNWSNPNQIQHLTYQFDLAV